MENVLCHLQPQNCNVLEPKFFYINLTRNRVGKIGYIKFRFRPLNMWILPVSGQKYLKCCKKSLSFSWKDKKKKGSWFWHIWIVQFWPCLQDNSGSKVNQKYKLWIQPVFVNIKIFQNILKHCLLMLLLLKLYFWWKFLQNPSKSSFKKLPA